MKKREIAIVLYFVLLIIAAIILLPEGEDDPYMSSYALDAYFLQDDQCYQDDLAFGRNADSLRTVRWEAYLERHPGPDDE
jgi:hypothetical protein